MATVAIVDDKSRSYRKRGIIAKTSVGVSSLPPAVPPPLCVLVSVFECIHESDGLDIVRHYYSSTLLHLCRTCFTDLKARVGFQLITLILSLSETVKEKLV